MKMSQISHAPVSFASKSHVAFFGSKKNVAANIFGKNCGVKNSSPDKLNMDSLGMLGNVLKQFPTESARFLQDSLVKFCAPAENPKLLEAIVPENFARIKMLNSLSASEKETLRRDLLYGDAPEFFITLSGLKPACIIGESKVDLGFLKKIKNDKLYGEKFDFVPIKITDGFPVIYILNKEKVLETISANKDFYIMKMELDNNSSPDEIYSELIKQKDLYLNSHYQSGMQDIAGITLGYPRYSSMMYQLEKIYGDNGIKLRNNPQLYRDALLGILHGENSPYKNLDKSEFEKLENFIKLYKYSPKPGNKYYKYAVLADEPEEAARVSRNTTRFINEFDIKNLF